VRMTSVYLALLTLFVAPGGSSAVAEGAADRLWTEEFLGPLQFGMSAAAVQQAIGSPASKSKPQLEQASGDWTSTWSYPALGAEVGMSARSKSARPTVGSLVVHEPSAWVTSRKVGLGASRSTVTRAYPKKLWDESSTEERLVVGTVYGGITFTFVNKKVSEIFFGASAE